MMSMKYLAYLILSLFVSLTTASAEYKTPRYQDTGKAEVFTCRQFLSKLVFDYTPTDEGPYSSYYDLMCRYPPATGTLLLCVDALSKDTSDGYMKKVYKVMQYYCDAYSGYKVDWTYFKEQNSNATEHFITMADVKNASLPIYSPINSDFQALRPTYIGYRNFYYNLDSGTWFSVGFCGFFLLLIIISAFHNFFRETSIAKSLNNSTISKYIQQYVIFPTVFPNGKFSEIYGYKYLSMLFPNRIQFITDVFIFALQIAFYCADYKYKGGALFASDKAAWHRHVADRSGIMAFGKIPLLVAFAGRNNFLLYITGWSYSTFLHFHKIVAYWMFLDAVIHSVAYTIICAPYYKDYLEDEYFACGVAATVFAGVILIFAYHPFRNFYYEYFLTLHVVFAVCFIVMCWYHCRELGWCEWLIASCCVWFFDRLLRVIRMSAFGFRNADITIVGDELFKVEVARPKWWLHRAGQYSYVYFAGWIFWENHPFTTVVEGNNICAYIKVKKGVTYRIWNKLKAAGGKMSCRVCFEGPYGGENCSKLKKYDDALLLAGGSGIPGILEGASFVSNGKLVWISQTLDSVKAYAKLIQNVTIDIDVYVTRESGSEKTYTLTELLAESTETESTGSETEKDDPEKTRCLGNCNINVRYGRPNVSDIIEGSVNNSAYSNVGIMACGPPRLMDDIRHTLGSSVTKWDKSIDFFDEYQIW